LVLLQRQLFLFVGTVIVTVLLVGDILCPLDSITY